METTNFITKLKNSFSSFFSKEQNSVTHIVESDARTDINLLTDNEQLKLISDNPDLILEIEKPREHILHTAIFEKPSLIGSIDKPTDSLVLLALIEQPSVISSLKELPSEKVLLSAVLENSELLKSIPEVSEDFKNKVLGVNGSAIRHIQNPSEVQIKLAINNDPFAIKFINNPSEEIQILAYRKDKEVISQIKDPINNIDEKAGWRVIKEHASQDLSFHKLPDSISVKLKNNDSHDVESYSNGVIELDISMKKELIETGKLFFGNQEMPGEISGGESALNLNEKGELSYYEKEALIEGGSVNYYEQNIPINVEDCKFSNRDSGINLGDFEQNNHDLNDQVNLEKDEFKGNEVKNGSWLERFGDFENQNERSF